MGNERKSFVKYKQYFDSSNGYKIAINELKKKASTTHYVNVSINCLYFLQSDVSNIYR